MNAKNEAGLPVAWIDPDDAPELTSDFFEQAEIRQGDKLIRRGRPPSGHAKQLISLRVDQDVLQRLRDLGPGWQTQAVEALRRFVEQRGKS